MLPLSLYTISIAVELPLLHKAKPPAMGVSSFATDNHYARNSYRSTTRSCHSTILMELRDTIQSDLAMDRDHASL
ncbi:hypothetical protein GBA52_028330 [Prunus armeniaca]|nr:hypothetical protein GBA52_028330 [Prunus armeniaca]